MHHIYKEHQGVQGKIEASIAIFKHTIDDKSIMGADILSQLCTWVNAAYGVCPDLKIQNGGCMFLGYVMVHCKYRK